MGRDYFMIGGVPGGWGVYFGDFVAGVKRRVEHKAVPSRPGGCFSRRSGTEPKRMETLPLPLIQLQTYLPRVSQRYQCCPVTRWQVTSSQFFCPANQLASSLLSSPWKRRVCPAWRQDFSTCRNREQVKPTHRLFFIVTSCEENLFYRKN